MISTVIPNHLRSNRGVVWNEGYLSAELNQVKTGILVEDRYCDDRKRLDLEASPSGLDVLLGRDSWSSPRSWMRIRGEA